MGLSISALRRQRGPGAEYTRDMERIAAGLTGDVVAALSRAERAEHALEQLIGQVQALRQQAALAAACEKLALVRADRAVCDLAALECEVRQLWEERECGRNNGSEAPAAAAEAAGEAAPQPSTPRTVVLKSALKRPAPEKKKKKFGFRDQLQDCRYFWRDTEPSQLVDPPSFARAASIHRPRHRLARSSTASMDSAPAAQQPAAEAQEAGAGASTAQLPGQGEAVAAASSFGASMDSPFTVAAQKPWGEDAASPVAGVAQPEAGEVPNPLVALAEVDLGEDLAGPPAAAAKADSGIVVSLLVVAAQPGCGDQGCQQAQAEPLYHTSTWWGSLV